MDKRIYRDQLMSYSCRVKMQTPQNQLEIYLKACADGTRLRILNLLSVEREICVQFFVEVIGTNQPKISRHLAYLKKAGMVEARKEGLWTYYQISVKTTEGHHILQCLSACFKESEELMADVRNLQMLLNRVAISEKTLSETELAEETNQSKIEEIQIELL